MYRSSSWIGVVLGLRTISSATVWCVSQPRHRDFEVAVACIQRIAQRRPRRMRRDGLIRQAAIRSGLHLHRALDNVVPISHRVMR
jgi:hypothetical protein